ncbi:hypothetical protein VP01_15451g1, partial [Puccinia sorghi]
APQKKKKKQEEEAPKKKFFPIQAVRIPHQKPPPHDPKYLLLLPEILQPYISKVLDVESDGHCSFRVVSYCLDLDNMNILPCGTNSINTPRKEVNGIRIFLILIISPLS